ncbi:hypothetical protein C8R45DRAFT_1107603 [Mycena sanguinolenta]|nr:hypothetical protein C8R45DRAFT_1107603 [Mycena sanguinolenta]
MAPPPLAPVITPYGIECPLCGNLLAIEVAKEGKMPGSGYVSCRSVLHRDDPFFHRVHAPKPKKAITASPATQSSSSSTRVHPTCANAMCRKHCILQIARCSVSKHKKNPRTRSNPAKPVSNHTPFPDSASVSRLLGGDFASYDEWMAATTRPIEALDQLHQREQAFGNLAMEERRLDSLYGVKSPTPETETLEEWNARQDREDAERLERGLHMSLAHPQPGSQEAGPSLRLPSPIQHPGRLRSLSLTPDPPATFFPSLRAPNSLSLHAPTPTLGRAAAPDVPGTVKPARKRLDAPSVQKTPKAPPLRITTQMNKDWMDRNGGPQVAGSSTPIPPPSTFHLKKTVARRGFADPQQVRRFTVVYFDKNDEAAKHRVIQDCPDWPQYSFNAEALEKLGDNIMELEMYSSKHGVWIAIDISYVHTLSTDCTILLRRAGIRGRDEHKTITTFISTPTPPHIRYNLPAEKSAVRSEYKEADVVISDSDSDTDVKRKRKMRTVKPSTEVIDISDSDSDVVVTSRPPRQRPRLTIDTSPRLSASSSSASESPSTLFSAGPSTSSSTSTPAPPSPLPSQHVWPYGMYTVDMVSGFMAMDSEDLKAVPQPQRFRQVYNAPYAKSTYGDQTRLWKRVMSKYPELGNKALAGQRTSEGLRAMLRKRVQIADA